tara:strand:- start:1493 stop:1981 length:489 start_codon:yes stop_codon:yes gene_type:complete
MINTNNYEILSKEFNDSIELSEDKKYIFIKNSDKWAEIAVFLYENKNLKFDYLMCLSGYDLGDSTEFGVAYNFYSTSLKQYIEIRIEINIESKIPSVAKIWRTADWHERETYDLFGIKFTNHPDLKRILLPEDWEGHPLRKDYKTPEYYNGMPVPKDKSYWE